jgi:hypothetical protein
MLISRPPPPLREAETLAELIVRDLWSRVVAIEDEIAGRAEERKGSESYHDDEGLD